MKKFLTTVGAVIGFVVLVIVVAAISWVATAFMVWLISLCFGFNFTLLVATGVWLSLLLLSGAMNGFKLDVKNER